jgi:hypothetical protein
MQDPKTSRLPQLVKKRLKRVDVNYLTLEEKLLKPSKQFLLLGLAFGHGIHFTVSHQGSL